MAEELTDEQKKWVKRLERVLRDIPIDLEIVVGPRSVLVHESGWWRENVSSTDLDLLMDGGTLRKAALAVIKTDAQKIRANCEEM